MGVWRSWARVGCCYGEGDGERCRWLVAGGLESRSGKLVRMVVEAGVGRYGDLRI
jgi:hypothetical protein